jgi:hypothetical protein
MMRRMILNMYGNLGTMYKKNYQFAEAILMLKLAIRGGTNPRGWRFREFLSPIHPVSWSITTPTGCR